jgi:signal transduction histidine kinase
VLAALTLVAIIFEPGEPARFPGFGYLTCAAYALLAAAHFAALHVFRGSGARWRFPMVVLDLAAYATLLHLSDATTSPVFLYGIFTLVAATMRWSWRGTAVATLAILSIVTVTSAFAWMRQGPGEVDRFIIRVSCVIVVGLLLAWFAAHASRQRADLEQLEGWRAEGGGDERTVVAGGLRRLAAMFDAPSAFLAWEEDDEPWLVLATWSRGETHVRRLPPDELGEILKPEMHDAVFAWAERGRGTSLLRASRWRHGAPFPFSPQVRELMEASWGRCGPLVRSGARGVIVVPGGRRPTPDDLVLLRIASRHVSGDLERLRALHAVKAQAATEARIALARDLHDGIVQSLTAASLHLQSAATTSDGAALRHVAAGQAILGTCYRELRELVDELNPVEGRPSVPLPRRLEDLRARAREEWGMEVDVRCAESVPAHLAADAARIVGEALANAARHGHARKARVAVTCDDGRLRIVVADEGSGFATSGRFDHDALVLGGSGPRTLLQRVACLGGRLTVESSDRGAVVDVDLPLAAAS